MSLQLSRFLLLFISLLCLSLPGSAQSFAVNFAQPSGPPLVKGKFGVYQTPLVTLPRLLSSLGLLREINVRDFRYEVGWGKPDVLAFDQIRGDAGHLQYDFSSLDALTRGLQGVGVRPLLAMGYCPSPLQTREAWPGWKDMPSSLPAWEQVNRDYAAHLKLSLKPGGAMYEIWNEPDMPEPNGKMFFSGSAEDYGKLYAHAARGIRKGDPQALLGGAATAYNRSYFDAISKQPLDFASIHAYDNAAAQISNLRGSLIDKPSVPIFLTEYASFTDFPAEGPQSRHMAAMRFFRDVKALLSFTDVSKVYWAQWLDAGNGPGMGLVTWDNHRKALFNAFKIYGAMPTDQCQVLPDASDDVAALASADQNSAALVLWNEANEERTVTAKLNALPFGNGTMELYRIDKEHASFVDNPASEDLRALKTFRFQNRRALSWTGTVAPQSVVFLRLVNSRPQTSRRSVQLGTVARLYHWFFDRSSQAYADFDERTSQARLGMGQSDFAVAQIGVVLDNPVSKFAVQLQANNIQRRDRNSLLGLRIDFPSEDGGYNRSVLYHGGLYDARRDSALPWGKGGALADQVLMRREVDNGRSFVVDLPRIAPPGWNRRRVVLSFVLQNAGRGAQARFALTARS